MRQITILDVVRGDAIEVRGIFWLRAPPNRKLAKPSFTSAIPLVASVPWGVTNAELTALRNGDVVETAFESGQFLTLSEVQTAVETAYSTAQTELNSSEPPNRFIGSIWDGTTWVTP